MHLSEEISDEALEGCDDTENVLVSSGQEVLMQTAKGGSKPHQCKHTADSTPLANDLQRTYITENLAEQLGLVKGDEKEIKLVTFGSKKKVIKTPSTALKIKLAST